MGESVATLTQHDPALVEASEAAGDLEVAVIARLSDPEPSLHEGDRVVTRFGDVVTLRVRGDRLAKVAESEAVLGLEAPRSIRRHLDDGRDIDDDDQLPADDAGDDELSIAGQLRRPEGVTATGRGVVVGVLDWGCDFAHPAFRREDGTTRLLAIWDQRASDPDANPNRWGYGRIFRAADIDRALVQTDPYAALGYHPGAASAHGTHVMDIAAGSGHGGATPGVAPEADLIFVHLARTTDVLGGGNLGDSASVLEALDFVFSEAGGCPVVVNMSVGAQGGPHDGTTYVEQGIDRAVSLSPGRAVINSSGNYFNAQAHAEGRIAAGETRTLGFVVPDSDDTDSELELWYSSSDRLIVSVIGPSGAELATVELGQEQPLGRFGRIYHNVRSATNGDNQIDLFLRPGAPGGEWSLRLRGDTIHDGRYHAWIERDRGPRPRFLREATTRSTTGTLCNGRLSIAVGAYDARSDDGDLGLFSSAGPTRDGRIKPELLAPGVSVRAARSSGFGEAPTARYTKKSGTSMAAPHVTGATALVFEAAEAPLEISDTRAILFASADRVRFSGTSGAELHRLGYGCLDIAAAERLARSWGKREHEVADETPSTPIAVETPMNTRVDDSVRRGDWLVRRVPYESLYYSAVIAGDPEGAEELAARGVPVELGGPGRYVEVREVPLDGGPARSVGRRLTDARGRLPRGQSIVRRSEDMAADSADEVDGDYREDLEELRRGLTSALQRGGASAFTTLTQLAHSAASTAGAGDVVVQAVRANLSGAVSALFAGGAQQLTQGATAFPAMAANASGLLIALLNGATDLERDMPALARALLDQAAAAAQPVPRSRWANPSGRQLGNATAGTSVLGTALTTLVARFNLGRVFPDRSVFDDLLAPLVRLGHGLAPAQIALPFGLSALPERLHRLLAELAGLARRDPRAQQTLLHMIEEHPHLGPIVLASATLVTLLANPAPWAKYMGKDLSREADQRALGARVHTLPAPGDQNTEAGSGQSYRVKYLVVSDVHRSAAPDANFAGGSLDHFSTNRALYLRVLDWVNHQTGAERHILIENGDAEEFWEVANLGQSPGQRVAEIAAHNATVYAKLKELHAKGRYFRTIGNHDGPLRNQQTFDALRRDWPSPERLGNWDFLLIPGVKTMDEFTVLDLLTGRENWERFIGADPNVYTNKKCLIVCHGHQFDFWNCAENDLLGRIVTAMVRYPDAWMDDVLHLGGIHSRGNPLLEFADFFADEKNLLFNAWPTQQPARVNAHRIQHLSNSDRQLQDGFMYQETLASSVVSLTMPLATCGAVRNASLVDRLGQQLLIGHTHYPQSQPFYPLGRLSTQIPGVRRLVHALGRVIDAVIPFGNVDGDSLVRRFLDTAVKSRYFNSGVSGWHDGVVYAIEITAEGQGRLLFFTEDHSEPQTMDWELSPQTGAETSARRAALGHMRNALSHARTQLVAAVEQHGAELRSALGMFTGGLQSAVAAAANGTPATSILQNYTGEALQRLWEGAGGTTAMSIGITELMARIARFAIPTSGLADELETELEGAPSFSWELPMRAEELRALETLRQQIEASGLVPAERRAHGAGYHLALVWMYALQYAPYPGGTQRVLAHEGVAGCASSHNSTEWRFTNLRTSGSMLAWLPMFATIGSGAHALRTSIASDGGRLRVTLELVPAQAPRMTLAARQPQPSRTAVDAIDGEEAQATHFALVLSWPKAIVDDQPADTTLTLSGGGEDRVRRLSSAMRDGDVVEVTFADLPAGQPYELRARTGDREVTLMRRQLLDDAEHPRIWHAQLDALIGAPARRGESREDGDRG